MTTKTIKIKHNHIHVKPGILNPFPHNVPTLEKNNNRLRKTFAPIISHPKN